MSEFNIKHNRAVWFDIPVDDLDRATKFYAEVLAISVEKQSAGDMHFALIEYGEGNGGCLVPGSGDVCSTGGILLYLNAQGRIREAVNKTVEHGGKIVEDVHSIGPHGFRALILDSEGNRVALHSETDA